MRLSIRPRFSFYACIAVLVVAFAVGCGGNDSGDPVYSGNSISLEERESGPVLVYEIFISDEDGNPYTKGLLVETTAFTPGAVFPVVVANKSGKAQVILETSIAGDYRVAIESFIDTQGRTFVPSPDDTNLSGKVVLTYRYEP